MKPYYQNESVTLYHGDCLEVMPDLTMTFDACITDPPYGTTACKWDTVIPFEPMWENLKRLIKKSGATCLFGSQPFTSSLVMRNLKMFKYDIVWDKEHGKAPGVAKYRPMPCHENISVFGVDRCTYNPQMGEGEPYTDIRSSNKRTENEHGFGYGNGFSIINKGTRYPLSVHRCKTAPFAGQHPTQKPVALIEYLIKTYTNEGESVLDFTSGSGTTGVACMNLNRKCVLIEKEEKYCEIAARRLSQGVLPLWEKEVE